MALFFFSDTPEALLLGFKREIDAQKVVTWSYDDDGDFTHAAPQWEGKAWLRPQVRRECLYFYILAPSGVQMSKTIYGVYHGRFMESLLTHCDELFTRVRATALPTSDDVVG
jgi:hypothetical protein